MRSHFLPTFGSAIHCDHPQSIKIPRKCIQECIGQTYGLNHQCHGISGESIYKQARGKVTINTIPKES
jgi:hypothetical protein